jgi:hypothetical protein
MESFTQFLDKCKDQFNHHQQNVKKSFEDGWKPILDKFREDRKLPTA